MPANPGRVKALFVAALETGDLSAREELLNRECGDDLELRNRLDALLAANDQAFSALDEPLAGIPTQAQAVTADFHEFESAERQGTIIAGKYKLLEQIGEGGMGTVWVAEQTHPIRRKVAIKLIKGGTDSHSVLSRFDAERQALALMDHPNIAKVLDAGQVGSRNAEIGATDAREANVLLSSVPRSAFHASSFSRPFFVMEYVKGVSITQFCDEARLSVSERLALFVQVCQAVQHAHQKGIIHRDLKPSNILVCLYDGQPVPKVIDFGLAKAMHQPLTEHTLHTAHGMMLGTPLYMSPEQAELNNLDLDTRTDIYALGVILYELLTGTTPLERQRFKAAAWNEMLRLIREEDPPRPSERLSGSGSLPSVAAQRHVEPVKLTRLVRGELDWIVMKCLEKDRGRRYGTANGLARDLERYLADEVVEARPPSAGYKLSKFLRKHRGPVIAASLVVLALVGGVIGTTWGLIRAESRRVEADHARRNEAAQRKIAEEESRRATDFRDKALEALRAATGEDVEKLLGAKTELGTGERAYLEAIARRWQAFADDEGTDEDSRAINAEGHVRVAYLWTRLGRRDEARDEYLLAQDILTKLVDQFPAEPLYRQSLAQTYNNLAMFSDDALGPEAQASVLRALEILGKLVDEVPQEAIYQHEFASTRNNYGKLLLDLGRHDEARRQFEAAIAIRQKLVERHPDEVEYQQNLASTHNNLAILLAGLSLLGEARAELEKSLDIKLRIAERLPDDPGQQDSLADAHVNLGVFMAQLGRADEARAQYERALEIRTRLAAAFPAVPLYQQELAAVHNNLGYLLSESVHLDLAHEQFKQAIAIQSKLVEQLPTLIELQEELAATYNNLGLLLVDLGRPDEARDAYERAREVFQHLVERFPAVPVFQIKLGGSYCNLGTLIRDGGDAGESLTWFDKAVAVLTAVHTKEPRDALARLFLRNSRRARAAAHDLLDQFAQAAVDWQHAIELSPPDEQPRMRGSRANSLVRAGQVEPALAEVDELSKREAPSVSDWYNFACIYAVAGGKSGKNGQAYADRAMELLQRATQAGFRDADYLRHDADLAPLREREDFQKLLRELEVSADSAEQ